MEKQKIGVSSRKRRLKISRSQPKVYSQGALPKIPVATHSFDQRYLFAFATQGEIIHHLRTEALKEDRDNLDEVLDAWKRRQPSITELFQREAGIAETIGIAPIPEVHNPRLQEIASDPLVRKSFHAFPFSFELLEIDKVVAAQRTVHLGYVDRLLNAYPKVPTLRDLIEICLAPERQMDPIQHLEVGPNTHVFSSPNSDLRYLGSFVKDLAPEDMMFAIGGGLPAAAIITFVGYGSAPIN